MKILYLGPKNKILNVLQHSYDVIQTEEIINDLSSYDWVVSYGYKHILKKQHIESSKNLIINLHISYLPWNRGADPNYWSWVENTPKGVTIHAIDKGIDTGDIFIQKEVNFENIIKGRILPTKQPKGGSLHYIKDFPGVGCWNIKTKKLIK